jgi:DNA uptake protein ComE-like DNA-binding protein
VIQLIPGRRWIFGALALIVAAIPGWARSPWDTLENCRYLVKRYNDGDSFHVSVNGTEYIFRLYFVDSPETSAEFRDRVEEQAKYFGITSEQALRVGEAAKLFTREKLSRPFIVRTSREDAGGRSRKERFYAFVQTYDGDLGEELVENGLARIHGVSAKPLALASAGAELKKLEQLQEKAKEEKVGGWGVNEGRMLARAAHPAMTKPDVFDAYFHSKTGENFQNAASVSATPVSAANPSAADSRLDINTASQAELENLPGIGPSSAQRIITARPFKSADDLKKVKGFGGNGKRYENLRPFFR